MGLAIAAYKLRLAKLLSDRGDDWDDGIRGLADEQDPESFLQNAFGKCSIASAYKVLESNSSHILCAKYVFFRLEQQL